MKKTMMAIGLLAAFAGMAAGQEGAVPKGIPHLDHAFVIMMENHGYGEIIGNPFATFINSYAESANLGTNYFAVAHPSLTNYLEVVGGSNFGVLDDNSPDWHNSGCQTNLATGVPNLESSVNNICPIAGSGTDAGTPLLDCTNEVTGPPCEIEIDNVHQYAANPNTLGITIAEQLAAANKTWKTYQEDLPQTGPDLVNYSDGNFTNNTDFTAMNAVLEQAGVAPLSTGEIVQLYAVKHNPFAYFADVQQGANPLVGYAQMQGFDGAGGLWSDLGRGKSPNFSYIVPNQCHDQHGKSSYVTGGNASPFCGSDPNDNGTQAGLNPALITLGDQAVQKIVNAIHASSVWKKGNNAIITIWDENDYSVQPIINQVVAIVDTNYGFHGITSSQFYDHFSLLRSLESGFGLPCLNHACDSDTAAMSDLFGGAGHGQH